MDRLTTEERLKIVKTYYECNNSNVDTFRALRGDYWRHNRPIVQGVGKIRKKFEETGSVIDVIGPVPHGNVCIAENIASVSKSVSDNPNLSIFSTIGLITAYFAYGFAPLSM